MIKTGYDHCIRKYLFLVIATLTLSACATQPVGSPVSHMHYRAMEPIVLSHVLPPPPVPGSLADRQDMQAVLRAQRQRTPAQVQEAQADAAISLARFQPVFGARFALADLPATTALFQQVGQDNAALIRVAKAFYDRPRPFSADPAIRPVVPALANAAYPSGHACFAYVTGLLLARMVPEKTAAIFARAHDYAQNRVIAGVHYPTDVQAGMSAAAVVVSHLLQDQQFQSDFEQAKAELRRALEI